MTSNSDLPETPPAAEAEADSEPATEKPGKRNAFTELMTSRSKKSKQAEPQKPRRHTTFFQTRDALGLYIERPETYPSSVVVYYNDDFVAIHDRFPKSSLHLLLLPRDATKFYQHPFDAFEDIEFLHKVQEEVKKLRALAARELQRRYGKFSLQEKARREAMEQDPPPDELPPGRDWEKEIMTGIHAHPSMNHLHIHVMSVDRYSDWLKHRKHYNSFSTPFFVPIDDFPLAADDVRRHPGKQGYLNRDFQCWKCSRKFGNKFQQLKQHLEEEFEVWKHL